MREINLTLTATKTVRLGDQEMALMRFVFFDEKNREKIALLLEATDEAIFCSKGWIFTKRKKKKNEIFFVTPSGCLSLFIRALKVTNKKTFEDCEELKGIDFSFTSLVEVEEEVLA